MRWLKKIIAIILMIIAIIAIILLTIVSFGGTIAAVTASGASIMGVSVGSTGFLASTAALLAAPSTAIAVLAGATVLSGALAYTVDSETAKSVLRNVSEFISDAASTIVNTTGRTISKSLGWVVTFGLVAIGGIVIFNYLKDNDDKNKEKIDSQPI